MDTETVVEALIEDARENDAYEAVVVDVPADVLREEGATYGDDGETRVETTLVAGPVAEEDDEGIKLRTPSRVGGRDDFSSEVREGLRVEGVYGFRDGNLDGVSLPKEDVTVHRVEPQPS
ncbi:hypothetical protein EGH25_08425 [Haladaptatus sp. F3-133]|uniref:Uncharacterized protein n=1 Tax=Halorutilus salinus TaxID=2487751 RepID=A0A9Q4C3V4_9EURY|nr:hypothetical protein [Halorutilus salinus]MCX2819375.1 hypothetical protein [Halorutilus salinus]